MKVRNHLAWACIVAAVLIGCGGKGGGGGPSPTEQIRFMASTAASPGTVTLAETGFTASTAGGSVFVGVVLTDTTGVFGLEYDLVYDSQSFEYVQTVEGTFLSENGAVAAQLNASVQPDSATTERIVTGYFRTGVTTPDIDAVGENTVLILEFRALTASLVVSPLDFDAALRAMRVVSKDGTIVVDETKFFGGSLRIEMI